NRAVLLTVSDNGPGMDNATLERAFTPFFSLQRAGRRRGLGLPRAKRQIEANGGRIWIQSSTATGTKVFILLPAMKE
ncbi:MAG: ATP-binding protein, partial [Planctomycetaceae bacterium]